MGAISLAGGNNGFYNSTGATFGSYTTSTNNPYQSAGAGNYYLTNTSTFLTNGTTNGIPSTLLSQLQVKTTQAPFYFLLMLSSNTIVTPVVQRDATGVELGFHYDPLDFIIQCDLSQFCTLTLTNGVALGYYGSGITLPVRSHLISQGTPNQRNYLVYFNLVQEQPTNFHGLSVSQSQPITPDPISPSNYPGIFLRFTTICAPTGETNLLNSGDFSMLPQSITGWTNQDCEIYGSGAVWQMSEVTNAPNVEFTNNVFYRVPFAINSKANITSINNLFYGTTNVSATNTTVSMLHYGGTSVNVHENDVYDGVAAALDGNYGYNAYLHGASNTNNSTNTNDLWTNVTWVPGTYGTYYQPSASPLLNNGSTNASNLGLFHYTVLTDNVVEASNVVSRGYHYVAAGTNGLPLDSNNDGAPDYLEDVNGDGTNDDGELSWNSPTAPWIGTQPVNQYAVAGAPATFSVTAFGTAPLTYQWESNGYSIGGATSGAFTIPSVQTNDVASYSVTVSSNYSSGFTNSSGATLTIVIPPQISNISPTTNGTYWLQTAFEALTVVITNAFYGSATPLDYPQYLNPYLYYESSYQWQFDWTNMPFASGARSIVSYIPTFDGGYNTAEISNPAGGTNASWTNIFIANLGMVEAWGENLHGECNRPLWVTNAISIAAGEWQSLAVTEAGSVIQWGDYYDKGNGNVFSVSNYSVATSAPASNVVVVAAGMEQGLALMAKGTVFSWGLSNDSFGINWSVQPNLTNVTAISCGNAFDLALSNGTVVAWGDNSSGQTAVPPYLTNVVAIAAGSTYGLAVQSNGTIVSWGTQPFGSTNVPSTLTNVAAIAAGYSHNLALQSNGIVVAWGDNTYGQCIIPAAASNGNVMAVAAGDYFSAALLINGTIVEWGDNTYGETTVPQSNSNNPANLNMIAAGGGHAMAAIWSPLVQYPVNVAKDLLLIYNSNSIDSWNVCQYYRTNRPMVSSANMLGVGCTTTEGIDWGDYTSNFVAPITNWLMTNPTKRPQYVVLFQDLPSRFTNAPADDTASVQYDMNAGSNSAFSCVNYLATWHPFVSSINMNGFGGAGDCTAYVDKLARMASNYSPGTLFITVPTNSYTNINWYFDIDFLGFELDAKAGVLNVDPSASIFGLTYPSNWTTNAINVAGYYTCGCDCNDSFSPASATNTDIQFFGSTGWYVMSTVDSFT